MAELLLSVPLPPKGVKREEEAKAGREEDREAREMRDETRAWVDAGPPAGVLVVTSAGESIPAHSAILASASPVLEHVLERARINSESQRVIRVLGVPCDAVIAFVRFLYSSKSALATTEGEEAMERHGVALLVLSHAYRVGWLKRGCEAGVGARVREEEVVDVLRVARLCDAPRLYQRCMRLVAKEWTLVQHSEGWRFAKKHDPAVEHEILRFLQEADQRKKRWRRERADQQMYQQLDEAMQCLGHIFAEGCTRVGPHDGEPPSKSAGSCPSPRVCEGLQLLLRHFTACDKKLAPKGCTNCKRMWQLFRLHSAVCDQQDDACKLPLCKQFKEKTKMDAKLDPTWRLLVRKVVSARVMSTLANRKIPELVQKSRSRHRGSN